MSQNSISSLSTLHFQPEEIDREVAKSVSLLSFINNFIEDFPFISWISHLTFFLIIFSISKAEKKKTVSMYYAVKLNRYLILKK